SRCGWPTGRCSTASAPRPRATAGRSCSPPATRMPAGRTTWRGTARTRTASRWSSSPRAEPPARPPPASTGSRRSELGDRGVAQHQALGAVRSLELHLDLRLLALPGDLGDRPHPEGVVGDPVPDRELGQPVGRGGLAAGAEAGALDVAAPTADASAEGGAAPAPSPIAAVTAGGAAAESGTAEGGAGARHVEHLLGHLVEEAAGGHELGLPPQRAHLGAGEVELLAGAGDAHVGQAPLLLELLGVAQGAVV